MLLLAINAAAGVDPAPDAWPRHDASRPAPDALAPPRPGVGPLHRDRRSRWRFWSSCVPLAAVFARGVREGHRRVSGRASREPDAAVRAQADAASSRRSRCRSTSCSASPPRGRSRGSSSRASTLLITLIDLPFAVSPVIAGLVFVLLFGAHGLLRALARRRTACAIIFAVPGHRARDALRDVPVRRARADPAHGGAGPRGGGGRARRSARAAGRCSAASRCRRSSGACSTA